VKADDCGSNNCRKTIGRPLPSGRILAHPPAHEHLRCRAGAIGGWVAAKLAVSGEQVMALTSSDALVGLG
jgi:hypothetical protein